MRRPGVGRILVALLYAFLGFSALKEAANAFAPRPDNPIALDVWQVVTGLAALATAFGAWAGARWAPTAAMAYGVIAGVMVAMLGPMLHLEPAARSGLYVGAAVVLLVGVGTAWYLRRTLGGDAATSSTR